MLQMQFWERVLLFDIRLLYERVDLSTFRQRDTSLIIDFPPGPPIADERILAPFFLALSFSKFKGIFVRSMSLLITSYMCNYSDVIRFGGSINVRTHSISGNRDDTGYTSVELRMTGNVPKLRVYCGMTPQTQNRLGGAIPLADILDSIAFLSRSFFPSHSPPPRICVCCAAPEPQRINLRPSLEHHFCPNHSPMGSLWE